MKKETTRKTADKKNLNKVNVKIIKFVNYIVLENLSQGQALAKAESKEEDYLNENFGIIGEIKRTGIEII